MSICLLTFHRVLSVRCADHLSHSYLAYESNSLEKYTNNFMMQTPKWQIFIVFVRSFGCAFRRFHSPRASVYERSHPHRPPSKFTDQHQSLVTCFVLSAVMPRLRNRRAHRLPPDTITVEVTVEIHQEDTLSSLYHTDRPATPLFPVLASQQSSSNRHRPQVHGLAQSFSMQEPPRRLFAEAALHIIAQNEMRGFRNVFTLRTPILGHALLPIDDVARVIWADIGNLLELGLELAALKTPRNQIGEAVTERVQYRVPVHHWLESLELLVCVDKPLYHMLHDALHTHTPEPIFLRWDVLRSRMRATGNTFGALVRQAEETSRQGWSSIVLEFYSLLLE
jgi:hypothetical protein